MNFTKFKEAVAKQFKAMSAHDLFRTSAEKDVMWATYLGNFPAGTNLRYRERNEYDCNCCRQFIRAIGNVVAVVDGKLVSIWDVDVSGEAALQAVTDAMDAMVRSHPINNIFLHTERTAGTDKNYESFGVDGGVKAWEHFFVNIPTNRVCDKTKIGPRLSEARALHDVLLRSLTEISEDAIDTVLELIAQNSLYRGEEQKFAVSAFKVERRAFARAEDKDNFVWSRAGSLPVSVSKIRNTAIGTLLVDLSEGLEMEAAVRKFEAMVAPANYKRPTALVTKAMTDKARATLQELGLASALDRRYATMPDITVPNTLFADRSARRQMGDVFDEIAIGKSVRNLDKVEEISIERFLADILPKADSIEVMFENRHINNLVSLIAPVDATAGSLFKWDNLFSWSYNGDFADSIKERVKQAGGNVTGELCCRLGWFNHDDLDFHMKEPDGHEIYFGNKGRASACGGVLDVDMNAGMGRTRTPVENIYYPTTSRMKEGVYKLIVNQYSQRESKDVGFDVEIDFKGAVYRFSYAKPVKSGENVLVAEFRYSHKNGMEFIKSLPHTTASKKIWNVDTEAFHKVNVVMLSPNHWDGHGVGNKHYFFMLDGCRNDGQARGFFNEFLKAELDAHRKVFEIVGSKMRTDEATEQLSGIGFSSTQRNHALVRAKGAFTRTIKVVF